MRLPNINTRFQLPIIHPVTRAEISAEALYNAACDAIGRQITDHIADLVFDNLDYDAAPYDEADCAPHIYEWARSVRAKLD